jgi:hypothetical protein
VLSGPVLPVAQTGWIMFDKSPATNPSPPVSLRLALANREPEEPKKPEEGEEESCPAFG